MTGGRQSDYALIVHGGVHINLMDGEFRFSGGTTISNESTLEVWNNLTSDVHVEASDGYYADPPRLELGGTLNGDLTNDGIVSTTNLCGPGRSCPEDHHPVINGNFTQSASGYLEVVLGWSLQIAGTAALDGGLSFYGGTSQSYVLPSAPASVLVLHADGGVNGSFVKSGAGSLLLLTGTLRYLPNDVYLDMTTVSASATMAAAGAGDALTLHSASHFDAALGAVAMSAAHVGASFNPVQRQFLASVGTIQRLQDYSQAARVFDSLSAHGYADAVGAVLQQATLPATELMARSGHRFASNEPQNWAAQSTLLASGAGSFSGQRAGLDQWFGESLLIGESFGWSTGNLSFDRGGGSARDQSPQWDIYLRHNGNGLGYVFGDVGYSRHQLNFTRQIDLGGGRHMAGSRRNLDVMRAYLETGRDYRLGHTSLTPFAAMGYAVVRGASFVEQGDTGFELMAGPSVHERVTATTGVRLGTTWSGASGRITQLNVTGGYQQLLAARSDARAAFAGAPDATFRLDGLPQQRGTGWLQLSLATGTERWSAQLSYDRQASDQALSLGADFRF